MKRPCGFPARQYGRKPRVLGHSETPSKRFMRQSGGRHKAQAAFVEAQQTDRVRAELLAKRVNNALKPHRVGEVGYEVGEDEGIHGYISP